MPKMGFVRCIIEKFFELELPGVRLIIDDSHFLAFVHAQCNCLDNRFRERMRFHTPVRGSSLMFLEAKLAVGLALITTLTACLTIAVLFS